MEMFLYSKRGIPQDQEHLKRKRNRAACCQGCLVHPVLWGGEESTLTSVLFSEHSWLPHNLLSPLLQKVTLVKKQLPLVMTSLWAILDESNAFYGHSPSQGFYNLNSAYHLRRRLKCMALSCFLRQCLK